MKITYEPIEQESEIMISKNDLYRLLIELEFLYRDEPEKIINIEQL